MPTDLPTSPAFLRRNGYRNRCELSGKAKVRQALEQTFCLLLFRTAVEVVRAEVVIAGAILEHVEDGGEDGSSDGADRLLGAASSTQPVELRLHITGLFPAGGPSALYERRLFCSTDTVEARPAFSSPKFSRRNPTISTDSRSDLGWYDTRTRISRRTATGGGIAAGSDLDPATTSGGAMVGWVTQRRAAPPTWISDLSAESPAEPYRAFLSDAKIR